MQPRRIVHPLVLVLLVLLILSTASPAYADPPTREPSPSFDIIRPASICGFPVKVEFSLAKSYFTTFEPNNGRWFNLLATGAIKLTATNLETGKSLDYNISGPAKAVFHEDGSSTWEGEGPAGWGFQDQAPIPGYPPIYFVKGGHWTMEFDAQFNVLSVSTTGKVEDVCAALSD